MHKRKKLVVDHALSLFVEKGIRQTSIQDILERAGISKGTFYNYFSSKHECVGAILEQARYDATLIRGEIMIGKDSRDIDVLVEQITVLSSINRSRGLDLVFEEILHSGDIELKKLVLKYRFLELDWLASRFIEVFGDDIRDYAFEAATLYYGMMQHLSFAGKVIRQNTLEIKAVANSIMKYMEKIVSMLVSQGTGVLDIQNVSVFVNSFNKFEITTEEIIEQLEEFQAQQHFTKSQQDVTDALLEEVKRETPREIVINSLLSAFTYEFKDSPYINDAKELSSVLWYLMKQKKIQ